MGPCGCQVRDRLRCRIMSGCQGKEMLCASTRKLLDLVQREQVSLIIFGHDGEQLQTFRKAPDCYG
jgi:hypothetical protein